MRRHAALLAVLLFQAGALPPEGRVPPRKIADLDGYSEGAAIDGSGAVFVSLTRRQAVMRIRPGAAPERWLTIDAPNGHRVAPDGTHLIAARGGVYRVAADGRRLDSVLIRATPELLPNDLALDGDGGYYVTAPAAEDSDRVRGVSRLFYVDSAGTLSEAARGFIFPNGIAVRADGKVLYVDDSGTNHVDAFEIVAPGRLGARTTFALLPDSGTAYADGMTLDAAGRLYVAHYGAGRVEVLDPTGHLLRRYPSGNRLTSNVTFGGAGLGDLYITGAPSDEAGAGILNRISLGVRGRRGGALPARVRR